MSCRLIDFALVVLKLLMLKVCVIIDISKIKFFNFSGNEIVNPNTISGNLTATISDYLPQSAMIHNMFGNMWSNKSNIYDSDWWKFDQENFRICEDLLKNDELNINPNLSRGINFTPSPPCFFSLNNSETVKALTIILQHSVTFC